MKKLIKMFVAGWSAGNKKRIVISLSTIGIVAAMAVGVTVSYFQDKETSTGNKFQAGKLNLKIDNTCHYNGMICRGNVWEEEATGSAVDADLVGEPCTCSWSAKDLTNEMFFDFLDVKPGDIGEDTVSLHVDNNDAWVCAEITNLKNFENGCDSPEDKIDTATGSCGTGLTDPGEGKGELQDNLLFTVWKDSDCDNKLDEGTPAVPAVPGYCYHSDPEDVACENVSDRQQCIDYGIYGCQWSESVPEVPAVPGEQILVKDQKATSNSWPIADSSTVGGPIKGNETTCLGIAWNVPITASNIIQTDSFTGDVIFNAVQARNMKNFKCSDLYAEVCDGVDNDYDNLIDNGDAWINKGNACSVGTGACSATGTLICNANNPAGGLVCSATPGTPGTEVCDDIDNNCDGQNNEGLYKDWYQDNDQDGFGNLLQKLNACAPVSGFVEDGTDCDDTSSAIKPGATEVCNGIDDDCNGMTDEGLSGGSCSTGLLGICSTGVLQCQSGGQLQCVQTSQPSQEMCNGLDDDCNGPVDDAPQDYVFVYRDADADGYGNPSDTLSCPTAGYIQDSRDCNDNNVSINPVSIDVPGNDLDENCNGKIACYVDSDNDTYGAGSGTESSYFATGGQSMTPSVCVSSNTDGWDDTGDDCDDVNTGVYPGATEIPGDSIDQNCDGTD